MFILHCFFRLGLLVPLFLVTSISQAEDVPNLRGSYLGGYLPTGASAMRSAAIPYIEQDNLRRLTGDLILDGNTALRVPLAGTIADSGVCTIFGSTFDGKVVYQSQWEKLGNGAGALFGTAALTTGGVKSNGTLFLFRPMTPGTSPKPDVRGSYSGSYRSTITGATGLMAAQIIDGTSNTLTLNMAFSSGRVSTQFACAGDVGADGLFVGIGVNADGSIAVVRGYIEQDLRGTLKLIGEVQLKSAAGKPIDTNSIIAILIG